MSTAPHIPPFLLREHAALAVYSYLLQSTAHEPRRILSGGHVVEIRSFEFKDGVDSIAIAVGLSPDAVRLQLDLLQQVNLLTITGETQSIQLACDATASDYSPSGVPLTRRWAAEDVTVATFAIDYLEHVSVSFAKKTHDNAKRVLDQFSRFVADKPLTSMTAEDLERFKASRKGHVSNTTINIDVRTIKAAFAVAERWGRIHANPFAQVKQIRIDQQKAKHLTPADFEKLLATIDDKGFRDIVVFATLTGLRRGELVNLKWSDFDETTSTLTVQSSAEYRVKGGKLRTIALHPEARDILDALPKCTDHVFCAPGGIPYRGDYVQKKLKKCLRAAGLPEQLHFHSLRHTFGTWAANAGVPVHIIKQMMGHSSVKTTEMYTGIDQKVIAAELRKVTLPSFATAPDPRHGPTPSQECATTPAANSRRGGL